MKPGRELDHKVHEWVMGGREALAAAKDQTEYEVHRRSHEWCPEYSTDIAAAWKVVEKLPSAVKIVRAPYSDGEKWQVVWGSYSTDQWVQAETAPHAICLAAMAAVKATG